MKRYLINLALLALAVTACETQTPFEQLVPPTIDVTTGADIAFKAIGGQGTIEVAPVEGSLQAVTAQSDWCHLSVSGHQIHVEVDPYDGLESRYAIIDMSAGNASGKTIVQQFGVIVKSYSWKDVTVKNNSQTLEFPYDANGSQVRATSDADWLTFETTPEKLIVHVAANPSADYREADVHWSIGQVTGTILIGQFDLSAGLLGEWEWHGAQQPNNRDFPMEADLEESDNGNYSLSLSYKTSSVEIALKIDGLTLEGNRLMLPLGSYVGTYKMIRTGTVYYAYPLLAPGATRINFYEGTTTGKVPFVLAKDESGQWTATSDMSAFAKDLLFRFEMWNQQPFEDERPEGLSSSGLVLKGIYLQKK